MKLTIETSTVAGSFSCMEHKMYKICGDFNNRSEFCPAILLKE